MISMITGFVIVQRGHMSAGAFMHHFHALPKILPCECLTLQCATTTLAMSGYDKGKLEDKGNIGNITDMKQIA